MKYWADRSHGMNERVLEMVAIAFRESRCHTKVELNIARECRRRTVNDSCMLDIANFIWLV